MNHAIPSRRTMLKAAGVAGLTLAIRPVLGADAAAGGDKPFVFALVTDTHLGRVGELDVEKLRAAVAEINKSNAELVLFCGDLVNAGENPANERRYPQFVEIANTLKAPWHAVPGNHDPVAVFKKHVRAETDFVVDRAPYRFICFADALPNPAHEGAVTADQVKWIGEELDKAARDGRRVFLLAHVTFHKNTPPDRGWYIEEGHEALAKHLEKYAKIIPAFFAGHHHVGLRGWDDTFGIHDVVLPSNSWNSEEGLAKQKDGYWEPDLREGWTLATVTGKAIRLEVKPVSVPLGPGVVKMLG